MINLREAIKLNEEELKNIKKDIARKAKESTLNAYINDDSVFNINDNGIPIAIKDNINVENWEITCASNILKGYKSPYNATVINKLNKYNIIPFGRTNMDEFAMGSTGETSIYGATKNPIDNSRVAGGSSSGSAAVVAGKLAIAALGSDTGGSIRQPAGYCGCVGLKPTYGSVSRYGLIAYSSSLDQIGPITQDVRDCALLFDIIKGYDKLDSTSSSRTPTNSIFEMLNKDRVFRIGVMKDSIKGASLNIADAYSNLVDKLSGMGHVIEEIEMIDNNFQISSYYITSMAEASSNLARYDGIRYGNRAKDVDNIKELYVKTRSQGFGDEVKRRILIGNFVLSSGYYDAYYLKAQKVREYIRLQYQQIFEKVDVILSPISPNIAPKIGQYQNSLEAYLSDIYTIGVNLAGICAISIPVANSRENMPIGIQIIGNHFQEQNIFDLALSIESKLKGE